MTVFSVLVESRHFISSEECGLPEVSREDLRQLADSLENDAPTGTGNTTAQTDAFHGRFVKLVTNEQVVEVVEFETTDPALRGEMTITYALADADGGTDVLAAHGDVPAHRVFLSIGDSSHDATSEYALANRDH